MTEFVRDYAKTRKHLFRLKAFWAACAFITALAAIAFFVVAYVADLKHYLINGQPLGFCLLLVNLNLLAICALSSIASLILFECKKCKFKSGETGLGETNSVHELLLKQYNSLGRLIIVSAFLASLALLCFVLGTSLSFDKLVLNVCFAFGGAFAVLTVILIACCISTTYKLNKVLVEKGRQLLLKEFEEVFKDNEKNFANFIEEFDEKINSEYPKYRILRTPFCDVFNAISTKATTFLGLMEQESCIDQYCSLEKIYNLLVNINNQYTLMPKCIASNQWSVLSCMSIELNENKDELLGLIDNLINKFAIQDPDLHLSDAQGFLPGTGESCTGELWSTRISKAK